MIILESCIDEIIIKMIKSKNSNNLKTERRQVIFLPFKKCLNINIFSAILKDQSSNLITRKIALGKIETKKKKKKDKVLKAFRFRYRSKQGYSKCANPTYL